MIIIIISSLIFKYSFYVNRFLIWCLFHNNNEWIMMIKSIIIVAGHWIFDILKNEIFLKIYSEQFNHKWIDLIQNSSFTYSTLFVMIIFECSILIVSICVAQWRNGFIFQLLWHQHDWITIIIIIINRCWLLVAGLFVFGLLRIDKFMFFSTTTCLLSFTMIKTASVAGIFSFLV